MQAEWTFVTLRSWILHTLNVLPETRLEVCCKSRLLCCFEWKKLVMIIGRRMQYLPLFFLLKECFQPYLSLIGRDGAVRRVATPSQAVLRGKAGRGVQQSTAQFLRLGHLHNGALLEAVGISTERVTPGHSPRQPSSCPCAAPDPSSPL